MTKSYSKLSIAEKRAAALAQWREQPVRCSACQTQVTPADLGRHLAERCPGSRDAMRELAANSNRRRP